MGSCVVSLAARERDGHHVGLPTACAPHPRSASPTFAVHGRQPRDGVLCYAWHCIKGGSPPYNGFADVEGSWQLLEKTCRSSTSCLYCVCGRSQVQVAGARSGTLRSYQPPPAQRLARPWGGRVQCLTRESASEHCSKICLLVLKSQLTIRLSGHWDRLTGIPEKPACLL